MVDVWIAHKQGGKSIWRERYENNTRDNDKKRSKKSVPHNGCPPCRGLLLQVADACQQERMISGIMSS
jgi:hypothetical protein